MRIRSDEHYIERGMRRQPPGWAGRYWRSGGVLVVLTTWVIAAFQWWLALSFWSGIMAAGILVTTWFVAAMLNMREKE